MPAETQNFNPDQKTKDLALWSAFVEDALWPKIEELRLKCEKFLEDKAELTSPTDSELITGHEKLLQLNKDIQTSLKNFAKRVSQPSLQEYIEHLPHGVTDLIVMVNNQLIKKQKWGTAINVQEFRNSTSPHNPNTYSKEKLIKGFLQIIEAL